MTHSAARRAASRHATRPRAAAAALIAILSAAAVAVVTADDPKYSSSWNAPDAAGTSFAGKKVAAMVMTKDQNLRISSEEQLVRELKARGVDALATYRMMPQEESTSAEKARPWIERAGVEGVVALRPLSAERVRTYSPATWTTTSYSTLWGYYGYGWTSYYDPGGVRDDTTLVVETLVYSVPRDMLLWAGVSTTTNPKDAQAFISSLVKATIKEMRAKKLVK
jgi:hypothetical protein